MVLYHMASYVIRDSSGKVKDASSDLKNYVGKNISDDKAMAITSPPSNNGGGHNSGNDSAQNEYNAKTQFGRTGVPVVKKSGETYEEAVARSAAKTSDLARKAKSHGGRGTANVVVSLLGKSGDVIGLAESSPSGTRSVGINLAKLSQGQRLAMYQRAKIGIPVIMKQGETSQQALQRSAQLTADLASKVHLGRQVGVSLFLPQQSSSDNVPVPKQHPDNLSSRPLNYPPSWTVQEIQGGTRVPDSAKEINLNLDLPSQKNQLMMTASSSNWLDSFYSSAERAHQEAQYSKSYNVNPASASFKSVGFGVAAIGIGFGEGIYQSAKGVVGLFTGETEKNIFTLATSAKARGQLVSDIQYQAAFNQGRFVGNVAGYVAATEIFGKAFDVGKNLYVSKGAYMGRVTDPFAYPEYLKDATGELVRDAKGNAVQVKKGYDIFLKPASARYVPKTEVFDVSSFAKEGGAYTRSASLQESMSTFKATAKTSPASANLAEIGISKESAISMLKENGRIDDVAGKTTYGVQTSSPAALSTNILREGVAGVGKKASLGLEDSGIYVNPQGRGSAAALGVGNSEYTLNPFKITRSLKGVPTVTSFETSGVIRYPRNVIMKAGFEGVSSFQESVAGEGVAIITKRSELAFGEIPAQKYFNANLGRFMIESGSAELEAVIPVGTKFKIEASSFSGKLTGYDDFTIFQGRAVAMRRASLVFDEISTRASGRVNADSASLAIKNSEVSGELLFQEQLSFSSDASKTPRSPYFSVSGLGSRGSPAKTNLVFSESVPSFSESMIASSSGFSEASASSISGFSGFSFGSSGFSGGSSGVGSGISSGSSGSSGFSGGSSGVGSGSSVILIPSSVPPPSSFFKESKNRVKPFDFFGSEKLASFNPEYFGDVTASTFKQYGKIPKGFRTGIVPRPILKGRNSF